MLSHLSEPTQYPHLSGRSEQVLVKCGSVYTSWDCFFFFRPKAPKPPAMAKPTIVVGSGTASADAVNCIEVDLPLGPKELVMLIVPAPIYLLLLMS